MELTEPVDWPDGTEVSVTPLVRTEQRVNWLSFAPFDVGPLRELAPDDDLLAEMLDDSRDARH